MANSGQPAGELQQADSKRMRSATEESFTELEPDIIDNLIQNLHLVSMDVLVDATLQTLLSIDQVVFDKELANYLLQFQTEPEKNASADETKAQVGPALVIPFHAIQQGPAQAMINIDSITQARDLDPEHLKTQLSAGLERILEMEPFFTVIAVSTAANRAMAASNDTPLSSRFGWTLILVRLVTRGKTDCSALKTQLLKFILQDFKSRMDLALFWLHEEFYQDSCNGTSKCLEWTLIMMDAIKDGIVEDDHPAVPGLDPTDRSFTRFLVEMPCLFPEALHRVELYCQDEERMALGMATLRDLITYRPAVRTVCLDKLLKFSVDESNFGLNQAMKSLKLPLLPRLFLFPSTNQFLP